MDDEENRLLEKEENRLLELSVLERKAHMGLVLNMGLVLKVLVLEEEV